MVKVLQQAIAPRAWNLYNRFQMDIPIHASVQCVDGPDGHVDRIIVDPVSQTITHIVVREVGLLGASVMVPVADVTQSSPAMVHIRLLKAQLGAMPVFIEESHVLATHDQMNMGYTRYGSYASGSIVYPVQPGSDATDFVIIDSTIPEGKIAVKPGDYVEATDGRVGHVEEFLMDPGSNAITHLVLREGHFWGRKYVTIPLAGIAQISEDGVRLKLSKAQIEALP